MTVKFCDVCGSPLDENGVCPDCSSVSKAPLPDDMAAIPPTIIYLNNRTNTSADVKTEKAEKKKPNILLPFAAVILALCILGGGVLAAFYFDWFGLGLRKKASESSEKTASAISEKSVEQSPPTHVNPFEQDPAYCQSQRQILAKAPSGCFLNDINLSMIGEAQTSAEIVSLTDQNGSALSVLTADFEYGGDAFYGFNGSGDLRRLTVTGKASAENKRFIGAKDLAESPLGYYNGQNKTYARDLTNFMSDGGDVYARVEGSFEYFQAHKSLNHRIVRFGSDGSVKLVGGEDVRAACFVVSGGWIYYADNGYTYDIPTAEYRYDSKRVGIYKLSTDGTKKTLLKGGFSGYKSSETDFLGNAGNLSLYNGRLYYISLSGRDSNTFLFSMKTDGSDDKRLSSVSVDNYAIDTKSNAAYLRKGSYGAEASGSRMLYRLDLNTNAVQPLDIEVQGSTRFMAVSGGYLYVYDDHRDFYNKCLKRVDLKTQKIQYLFQKSYKKTEKDDETGIEKRTAEKAPEYRWAEYRGNSPL